MKAPEQIFYNCEQPIPTQTAKNDNSELMKLSAAISEATIKWMTMIAQNRHDAISNYSKDHTYLQKGMWYANDLLKACIKSKEFKMVTYIEKNNKQHLGFLPTDYFKKIPKSQEEILQIKFRSHEFLAKPNVLPSSALKAAITGLSIIDCGMACQIARYGALHDVLGEQKFNILFGNKSGQLMNIGFALDDLQPMIYFVKPTAACKNNLQGKPEDRPVKAGQLIGFEGAKYYRQKHPFSDWGNLNTFCICDTPGQQKFIAFGGDPAGNTEKEICKLLYDDYKEDRDPFLFAADDIESIRHSKKEYESAHESVKIWLKQLYDSVKEVEGFQTGCSQEFIVELIDDLIKLPLKNISMDFVKSHPINKNRFAHINQNSGKNNDDL